MADLCGCPTNMAISNNICINQSVLRLEQGNTTIIFVGIKSAEYGYVSGAEVLLYNSQDELIDSSFTDDMGVVKFEVEPRTNVYITANKEGFVGYRSSTQPAIGMQMSVYPLLRPRTYLCDDGALFGECSATKPKYCQNGSLIDNCQLCGCLAGQECQSNGKCRGVVTQQFCSGSTPYRSCSATKPKYCQNGSLIDNCQLCGCSSGKECQTDGSCSLIIQAYQCPGTARDALCYTGGYTEFPFLNINGQPQNRTKIGEPFDFQQFQIWSEYPAEAQIGQEFEHKLFFKNKLSQPLTLLYAYDLLPDFYEKISSDILTNDYAPKRGLSLRLQAGETKEFSSMFKAKKSNIFERTGFLRFNLWLSDTDMKQFGFANKVPFSTGVSCGGQVFPGTYTSLGTYYQYTAAKCCDDIFYPSSDCCSDNDCSKGRCIDGRCMSEYSMIRDPAIGNKKVLMILSSTTQATSNDACSDKEANYRNDFISDIENYYDSMAVFYLDKTSEFINFAWDIYGNFNTNDLGLSGQFAARDVLDKAIAQCNINAEDYDEIIVYNPNAAWWCGEGYAACAGKPIQTKTTNGISLYHEIAHNFGCSDLYRGMGGFYQWYSDLMGWHSGETNISEEIAGLPGLQVCRGELGWADLNKNNIPEILEYSFKPETIEVEDFVPSIKCGGTEQCFVSSPTDVLVYGIENNERKQVFTGIVGAGYRIVSISIEELQPGGTDKAGEPYYSKSEIEQHETLHLTLTINYTYTDNNWQRRTVSDSKTIERNTQEIIM